MTASKQSLSTMATRAKRLTTRRSLHSACRCSPRTGKRVSCTGSWGTNTYPNIPWGALSPEKALTAEQQRLVEDQVALFNAQIASEARVTHSLLNRYSREYVEGIKPVALNAPAPAMTPQEAAQMQNAAYSCLGTDVTTGKQFNIRFFSSDYPDLEDSFQRIRTLKAERLATTKRLISEI